MNIEIQFTYVVTVVTNFPYTEEVINLAKRPLFKHKNGNTTPVLSKKNKESDADAVIRLKAIGWNPDKVSYHVVDGKNVTELHAGDAAECSVCSNRKGKTGNKTSPAKEKTTKATKDKKTDVKKKATKKKTTKKK